MTYLVLGFKQGESVYIDGDIIGTVTEIGRHQVKIAFQAPSDVTIDREVIHKRKLAQAMQKEKGE